MADIKAIAEALINITSEEVAELAKTLKDEYGIEAEKTEEEKATLLRMDFRNRIPKRKRQKK